MSSIPQVSHAMQQVLIEAAELADKKLHYTKRPDRAKFSASTLTQTLVLGFLALPDATVEQLSQSAARLGLDVSPQAIDQRFSFQTAALLREVLSASTTHLIAADPVAIPLLQRFSGVRVQDSTTIVLPDQLATFWTGCGGSSEHNTAAALKSGVQLDLLTGALSALELVDGRHNDHRLALQKADLPPGCLRLADLGFYDLEVLADYSRAGVYWLSKLEPSTRVAAPGEPHQSLLEFVRGLGQFQHWQGSVWIGRDARLECRLLIERVPQEVADQRRRRLRAAARQKGRTLSETVLALADWTIVITNVPEQMLSVAEALVLLKVRWQIELLFKLWKSQGKLDEWRTQKVERILCEVYAKLVAMVIQHWLMVVGCWQYAERSLVKAAQVVRAHALELASARGQVERWNEVQQSIHQVLKRTARMNSRSKHPNTYQLLLALTTEPQQA